jgi:hypothetical protein
MQFYSELAICLFDLQLGGIRLHLQSVIVYRIDDHGRKGNDVTVAKSGMWMWDVLWQWQWKWKWAKIQCYFAKVAPASSK